MKMFTARATAVGMVTGALVAVLFGPLIGAPWGLATLNGAAIGTLVPLVNCAARLGLFRPRQVATPSCRDATISTIIYIDDCRRNG